MSSSFNPGQPSVPTTPASVSPFEQLAYSGLFDEDDCDGSNDSRSRRPSGNSIKSFCFWEVVIFFVFYKTTLTTIMASFQCIVELWGLRLHLMSERLSPAILMF